MEITERQWHEELATKLKEAELIVKRGEKSLVIYRAQIGQRLNDVYGAESIPFLDLEELTKIYDCRATMLKQARTLAARTVDESHLHEIATEYGNWTAITKGFLPGYTAKTTRRMIDQDKKNGKTRRQMANASDELRDSLMDKAGLSYDQARDAVKLYLKMADWREVAAIYSRREELAAWRELKASLVSRDLLASRYYRECWLAGMSPTN